MRHPSLLALLLLATAAHAQEDGFNCLANDPVELARRAAQDPDFLQHAAEARAELDAASADHRGGGGPYVIPVVFHIIHNNGVENISDAQVEDAVRILNEDYSRMNPDWTQVVPAFIDLVADVGIEFRLARLDPQGNCTNGITRTVSNQTSLGDFEMTQLIQWPRERYMNVWVCRYANGAAGYTYYPIWLDTWPEADGIVVQHNYLGSIGTGSPFRSRVLSHETGHWLNLKHCWGDSNEPGDDANCGMDDDVEDTPLTRGWTSCLASGASCGSVLDNVQNYMEYAYCSRMFTLGQADRMITALTSSIAQRSNLWQPGTLALTGVLGPGTVCEARFTADRRSVCAGGSVTFDDQSFNGVVARAWSFPGGQPDTSTDEQPEVTYPAPGLYPVSLVVSDALGGSLAATESSYIRVLPSPGQALPVVEGFESATALPNDSWEVVDPSSDGSFVVSTSVAYSGSRSARLPNTIFSAGRTDELISATYDLSGLQGAIVTFRYAYAKRYIADDDALYVWVSGNCGDSWYLRKVLRANTGLLTAGVVPGTFSPSAAQWHLAEITNIGTSLCTPDFRIRFQFVSDGGNDLYIDDINIMAGQVGIEEEGVAVGALSVRMDPTSGAAEALVSLRGADRVQIDVLDALGRVVHSGQPIMLPAGTHRLPLPLHDRAAGQYVLRVQGELLNEAIRFAKP